MTLADTLSRLEAIAAGNPTPEELLEASGLALQAKGWTAKGVYDPGASADCGDYVERWTWYTPDGDLWQDPDRWLDDRNIAPHPAASLDDAVEWMVPEGTEWEMHVDDTARVMMGDQLLAIEGEAPNTHPALALTIASLRAEMEE